MSDDLIDDVTRAILLADAARHAARMEARKVTMKEKHPANRAKKAAIARSIETRAEMRARGEPKGRWGESDRDRALLALACGAWLAHSDIGKRANMTTQTAQLVMAHCARRGLVERAENEDQTPKRVGSWRLERAPKYLWRLTRAGEAVEADIRAHMGEAKEDAGFARLQAATERRRAQRKAKA